MCINVLSKSSNPNGHSPHMCWIGEPAEPDLFRNGILDLVLVKSETIDATKPEVVYAFELGPAKPHLKSRTHNYLSLETLEIIKRDDAVPCEMTEKHAAYINEAVRDPKSPLYSKRLGKKYAKKQAKKPPGRPPRQPTELPPPRFFSPPPAPVVPTEAPPAPDERYQAEPPATPVNPPRTPMPEQINNEPAGQNRGVQDFFAEEPAEPEEPHIRDVRRDRALRDEPSPLQRFLLADELDGTLDRVMPDGSIARYSFSRHTRYIFDDATPFYLADIKLISYHNLKADLIFARSSQISLMKSLKQYPIQTEEAIRSEIKGLLNRKVWTGTLRSNLNKDQKRKIIRSSCFIKQKFDSMGRFLKWKARIVSDGSMQDRNLYSTDDISAPTVQLNSLFTLSTIAAAENLKVKTMDIAQAYLNADMKEDVFIILQKEIAKLVCEEDSSFKKFLDEKGALLVKLNKAQYGCLESAKLWYSTLSNKLELLGFVKNPHDPCVFIKTLPNNEKFYLAIYVDDTKAFAKHQKDLDWLQIELEKSFGKLNSTDGKIHEYLGMQFDYSSRYNVKITMLQYIKDVIKETHTDKVADTPAAANLFEVDPNSTLLPEIEREQFHHIVAKLLFASVRCRPDILLPVIFLTSRVTKATREDDKKLARILKYLNGTADLGITLGADKDGNLRIHTYADASFGVHPDTKSQSGIFISLGKGGILCKAVKQKIVTKSSTEAELVTLSDATSLAAYQLLFLESIGYKFAPAIMYQDNMSTMRLAENGRSNSDRTKHIKLRYFFIKQYLDSGEFELVHCPTDMMIADTLTKPLQGETFKRLRDLLLGVTSA